MSKLNPNGLPRELKDTGRWCVWRYEQPEGRNKPTKVPYNPRTGGRAMSNSPNTFTSYQEAVNVLERGRYDGLGVGLFDGLCAVDIDNCLSEDGTPSLLALDIVSTLGSYTETSPSGQGIRIFFRASGFAYDKNRYYTMNASLGLEIYVSGATSKFLTVTGNSQTWGGIRPIEERTEELQTVLDRYMVRPQKSPQEIIRTPETPVCLSDEEIITRAQNARNGAVFAALWNGDTSAYGSHSEADLALCNLLAFWTGGNAERVDRLFRGSGLMRAKWDRPQSGTTYGAQTVQKAVEDCRNGGAIKNVRPGDFSDSGNAEIFCALNEGQLLFTDSRGWLCWDGVRWVADDHKAMLRGVELSQVMLDEARETYRRALYAQADARATGDSAAVHQASAVVKREKEYQDHAQRTRSMRSIKAMVELAKHHFAIDPSRLDANPAELNTPAGIVDLTTGELRPCDRAALCSKVTACAPGTTGMEMWGEFLRTVTEGDNSQMDFLQQVAGMALFGKVYEEGIVLAYGGGKNGKSTLFNVLLSVLGDYAGTLDISVLTTDRQNRGAALATLRGKRLVVAGELEEGKWLSVSTLKQISSTDPITVEEKYRSPETIIPSHTLVLYTNHLPSVESTDEGTWRRLRPLEFKARINGGIPNYAARLVEEAGPSILNWTIQGAMSFAQNGYRLQIPDTVAKTMQKYREREDWLSNFLAEYCIPERGAKAPAGELYQLYREWAKSNGERVQRNVDFNATMEGHGFHRVIRHNKRSWDGLRITIRPQYNFSVAAG